jgi:acylphosphatase
MTRRTIFFSGHVQGVGFRFVTRQIASSFDVKGYVRNLPDGRVQLVVEGDTKEIDALVERIGEKMQGYLEQVTQQESPATGEFAVFEIRR